MPSRRLKNRKRSERVLHRDHDFGSSSALASITFLPVCDDLLNATLVQMSVSYFPQPDVAIACLPEPEWFVRLIMNEKSTSSGSCENTLPPSALVFFGIRFLCNKTLNDSSP
jgi:hypothetical protein